MTFRIDREALVGSQIVNGEDIPGIEMTTLTSLGSRRRVIMPTKFEQVQYGHKLNIIEFLGNDSEALGGLQVASRTYGRDISRLEMVAHPSLGMNHLLDSNKSVAAIAGMQRLTGALDIPKGSLKTVLLLRRSVIGDVSKAMVSQRQFPDVKERIQAILSVASMLKANAKAADKQVILYAVIREIDTISKTIEGSAAAISAHTEALLSLIPLVGNGDLPLQRKSRELLLSLLSANYRYALDTAADNVNPGARQRNFAILDKYRDHYSAVESLFTHEHLDATTVTQFLMTMLFGDDFVICRSMLGDHSVAGERAKIRLLDIYFSNYIHLTNLVRNPGENDINPQAMLTKLMTNCPEGDSQELVILRLYISRIFVHLFGKGGKTINLKHRDTFALGKFIIQTSQRSYKYTEEGRKTLANLESIITTISHILRQGGKLEFSHDNTTINESYLD